MKITCHSHAYVEWGTSFHRFRTITVTRKKLVKHHTFYECYTTLNLCMCIMIYNHICAETTHLSLIILSKAPYIKIVMIYKDRHSFIHAGAFW